MDIIKGPIFAPMLIPFSRFSPRAGKLHTTACYLRRNWVISSLREALRARYSEKWELENPLVNMEFDSFQLSGECVTILHEPMRMEVPDLLCVTG